jgi:hypothetical protein
MNNDWSIDVIIEQLVHRFIDCAIAPLIASSIHRFIDCGIAQSIASSMNECTDQCDDGPMMAR